MHLTTITRRTGERLPRAFRRPFRIGVVGAFLLAFGGPLAAGPAPAYGRQAEDEPRPVRFVVLVDESSSLRPEGMAAERIAAKQIAQSEFAPGSAVAVIGFGADNGVAGQHAVDVACPMTSVVDSVRRDGLAKCVDDLHIRTAAEGDGTDFTSALREALTELENGADPAQRKIVFLLTDGRLHVDDSPKYGVDPARRNAEARRQLQEQLRLAANRDVQIWPLGFGGNVDESQLAQFAASGSQKKCNAAAPAPRAFLVRQESDAATALFQAFAGARCAVLGPIDKAQLPTGESVDLKVTVPQIATDGSIAVRKEDPRISVSYVSPSGVQVPKIGTSGTSRYDVSGENSTVEVLRIADPQPGVWTVRLRSAPGVGRQQVSASVVWQGVLSSSIATDRLTPAPGDLLTVRVHLQTRTEALTDADTLRDLRVGVQLTGDGFGAPAAVPLVDDGTNGDATARDGEFAGRLTVPASATGPLRLVSTVSGPGIEADERPLDFAVRSGLGPSAQIRLDTKRVAPGGRLHGSVIAVNESAQPVSLLFGLTDFDAGTLATISPPTARLELSGRQEFPFTVKVDPASRLGPAQLRVRVVDAGKPDTAYADGVYAFEVNEPPWPQTHKWELAAAAVVVLAGTLVALWAGLRRRRRQVHELVVVLRHSDGAEESLPAPQGRGTAFAFMVRDTDTDHPRLDRARPDESAYAVRRASGGGLVLQPPAAAPAALAFGQPFEIGPATSVLVRDTRAGRIPLQPVPADSDDPEPEPVGWRDHSDAYDEPYE